jgi:hypothetical protein
MGGGGGGEGYHKNPSPENTKWMRDDVAVVIIVQGVLNSQSLLFFSTYPTPLGPAAQC